MDSGAAKKRFCCDQCVHSTDRLRNLKTHIEDMHGFREVKCTRCSKDFTTVHEMRQHRSSCLIVCKYVGCTWSTLRSFLEPGH